MGLPRRHTAAFARHRVTTPPCESSWGCGATKGSFSKGLKLITLVWVLTVLGGVVQERACASDFQDELRGVWLAWAGANVPSKERIAAIMDDVAARGMNAVFVDVWRYGYPYFRSELFYRFAGMYTDPALPEGRDVLADMIAEGHRVGLHVHAWFEYGFVACQGDNDHLFRVKPEWFARRRDGSVLFNGDYRYKWLSHCNPEAQQFLVALCLEVARNYDIDGMQLDRIRYPELDCGYDEATVMLYKTEHGGKEPPQNVADPQWMRWRADKLTSFMAAIYDSLKRIRPDLPVSNTPIVYPYGYQNFCQDWRPWINDRYLDMVCPQVYRATEAIYSYELDLQLGHVTDRSRFYPGITSIFEEYLLPSNQLIAMIQATRSRGVQGHVIWFYDTLSDDLPALAASVYQQQARVPGMPSEWRRPAIIVNETDSTVARSGNWHTYTGIAGYQGGCLYTTSSAPASLQYTATIPSDGWYELYAFVPYHWNGARQAHYEVIHSEGVDTVLVNQGQPGKARWCKLGDYHWAAGASPVLRLSNTNVGNRYLFADAIMLCNNNRAAQFKGSVRRPTIQGKRDDGVQLVRNFPNPFNAATAITFEVPRPQAIDVRVMDLQGRCVAHLLSCQVSAGRHVVPFQRPDLPSGVYFCYVTDEGLQSKVAKMLLLR